MTSQDHKPWWELEGKAAPHDEPIEAERERLRSELARAWRSHLDHRESCPPHRSAPAPGTS
ncbi:MAG TPA: hypothetical protein VIJ20_02955 [Solirubrobacteraceae bacterium]